MDVETEIENQKQNLLNRFINDVKVPITDVSLRSFNQATFKGEFLIKADNILLTCPFTYSEKKFNWVSSNLDKQLQDKWMNFFVKYREEIEKVVLDAFSLNLNQISNFTCGHPHFAYLSLKDNPTTKRLKCTFDGTDWKVVEE
jgi:hypothetical protein